MTKGALTLAIAAVLCMAGSAAAARHSGATAAGPAAAKPSSYVKLTVLSNRADLLSGGDALVEVLPQGKVDMTAVRIDVDGRDVTAAFSRRADGRYLGLVEGLALGENVLTARTANRHGARITLTNHPIGGPIFSGQQVQPWLCTTDANGLGPPQDAKCNAPTRYEFFYWSVESDGFEPYDPASPPPASDVAQTTTDQGKTVPYIIRQETGTQNRGIYTIAVLYDPATSSPVGWNQKLLYPFGASCGTIHSQSDAQNVQDDMALSRGFMVATSSMNVLGNNCNTVTSAESVMMLKERITERYGEIRYTIGNGCSGGSIGQHVVANGYPGLVNGIQPTCSFPDSQSLGLEVVDCHMLVHYFNETSPHLWANLAQRAWVDGHEAAASCQAWSLLYSGTSQPRDGCGIPAEQHYDPQTNPTGCRGTTRDFMVAVLGKRPQSVWTAPERIAGGFAKSSYDNVGVQYGLQALLDGKITTEQFVDLNEKLGGTTIDFDFIPERKAADEDSTLITHRAALLNDGRQLDQVPIIDLRPSGNPEFHTDYHSYSMRERLKKANGHADNQIIWTSPAPLVVPEAEALEAFLLMDRWLAAIEADTSTSPLAVKVARNKPADAVDACWINDQKVTDMTVCRTAFPYFGAPRIVAGGPLTNDVLKCQLKPMNRAEYGLVPFTDAQWLRLVSAFPGGVCDWSKPGVGQVASVPWLSFAAGPGGQELPPAPTSKLF
jgi:hypothetical protein